MEPIVSPLFIYFLSIVDKLIGTWIFFAVILGLGIVVCIIGYVWNKDHSDAHSEEKVDEQEREASEFKKFGRKLILPFSLFFILSIFTPSKKIIIAMYVTKFVTVDNVTKAIEAGGNFKDDVKKDIIDIIKAMKGEKSEDSGNN